ncbi:hypothetical protein A4R43_40075 [Amycolatopsis albispora]|uniref:DUF3558 domain-containing protein n=1 Tax=Amycolatopsis albispora TaxID=1804986 RepID=A0A344LIL4_9PSEU|nr:hypothetical protein A4R43_40075 [Amycolatopsis albispora]
MLIGIVAAVVVLLLAGAGVWVFVAMDDSGDAAPRVDASQDLPKAPGGCAVFDEHEVKPHIPGRMEFEVGSVNGSNQLVEQGQCNWNNSDTFTKDKVRPAFVIVTSYVYRATQTKSGVDAAKEHLQRRVKNGVEVNVKGAEEALLVAKEDTDFTADVTVRYRNVVYHVDYSNQTDGAPIKPTVTDLAATAIGKVVPNTG